MDEIWTDEDKNTFFTPRTNVIEREKDYFLKTEIPSVKKEDVNISIENNILRVKGQKEKKDGNYYHYESNFGSFECS